MTDEKVLAELFEEHRSHLRAVAYRMLGSLNDADDAVQEAWLRLSRTDSDAVDNLAAWLTTVVSRICLNVLRSRQNRREDLLGVRFPDPIITVGDSDDPQHQALLADSVGLALLVVLEALTPAERLAFVLHDMFAMPFDEIAPLVDRTPAATRQLASRARRRVQDNAPAPDPDFGPHQRAVVEAFLAAARNGDMTQLMLALDPNVILYADRGAASSTGPVELHGADAVADSAVLFATPGASTGFARVNGAVGAISRLRGRTFALLTFVVRDGRIARIDVLADPDRLADLDLDRE